MAYSYRLAEKAEADVAEIYAYGLDTWGEAAATRYYYALHERFRFIAEWPYLYQVVASVHERYRRSVYGEHSIYYRIAEDAVEIMAILRSQDIDAAL